MIGKGSTCPSCGRENVGPRHLKMNSFVPCWEGEDLMTLEAQAERLRWERDHYRRQWSDGCNVIAQLKMQQQGYREESAHYKIANTRLETEIELLEKQVDALRVQLLRHAINKCKPVWQPVWGTPAARLLDWWRYLWSGSWRG